MVLLLVRALGIGLSFGLYRENARMKENDIKFRMIRQSLPNVARWADTTYHRNPKAIERVVKKMETDQLNYIKAKSAADPK